MWEYSFRKESTPLCKVNKKTNPSGFGNRIDYHFWKKNYLSTEGVSNLAEKSKQWWVLDFQKATRASRWPTHVRVHSTTNSFIAMAMTPSKLCKFVGHKVVYSKLSIHYQLPNHVFYSTFSLFSKKIVQILIATYINA